MWVMYHLEAEVLCHQPLNVDESATLLVACSRIGWYVSPEAMGHRLKLHTFKELIKRFSK